MLAFVVRSNEKLVPGHLNARPRKGHLVSAVSAAPGFSIPNYTVRALGRTMCVGERGTFSPIPVPRMETSGHLLRNPL